MAAPPPILDSPATSLTSARKAAVLLLALNQDAASLILRELDPESIAGVTRELEALGGIPPATRERVIAEFYELALAETQAAEAGLEQARHERPPSAHPSPFDDVPIDAQGLAPAFAAFQACDASELLALIRDEHPQTAALLVSHLLYHKASEVLAGLSGADQVEVVRRVAHMEPVDPAIIAQVEQGLAITSAHLTTQSAELPRHA